MRAAHRPAPDQLNKMITHVAYEVAALEASAERFAASDDRFIMEAFLLHARLLREFIWGSWQDSPRYKDSSVYAEDYFTEPTSWSDRKGTLPPIVEETKDAVDKQLAHVCRERTDPNFTKDLEPKMPQIRDALVEHWDRFVRQLGSDSRADHLKEAHAAWRKTLKVKGAT